MKHSIKCNVCGELTKVNGQSQISNFVGNHKHGNNLAGITGENVTLDNSQDRITLKIDPKPLITHGRYNPNDKYLR